MTDLDRWQEIRVTVTPQGDLVLFANGATRVVGARSAEAVVAALRAMFTIPEPKPVTDSPTFGVDIGRKRNDGQLRRSHSFYYRALANVMRRKNNEPFTGVELALGHGGFDSGFTSFVSRAKRKGLLVKVSSGKQGRYQVTQAGRDEIAKHLGKEEE